MKRQQPILSDDDARESLTVVELLTKRDINGNSRRLWLVLRAGILIGVYDDVRAAMEAHGFAGGISAYASLKISVPPAEYRKWRGLLGTLDTSARSIVKANGGPIS